MPKDKREQAQADKRTKKLLEAEIGRMRSDAEVKRGVIEKKEVKIAEHEADITRLRTEVESLEDAADAIENDLLSKYTDDEPLTPELDTPQPL